MGLLIATAAAYSIVLTAVDQSALQQNVTLHGRVLDGRSGCPLRVGVTAASPVEVESTMTDAQGRFVFLHLMPGEYGIAPHCDWSGCLMSSKNYQLDAGVDYTAAILFSNANGHYPTNCNPRHKIIPTRRRAAYCRGF